MFTVSVQSEMTDDLIILNVEFKIVQVTTQLNKKTPLSGGVFLLYNIVILEMKTF